jgi:hypothetical protein
VVQLLPASEVAAEIGKSEMWVLRDYRIRLWQNGSSSRGSSVGSMIPGSNAEILEEKSGYYKVKSPLDGSIGWISSMQVAGTRLQNRETRAVCR